MLLVSKSLRFGSLLYPIKGFVLKICVSSSVFLIIFQLPLTRAPICGFRGLNCVTMTGASLVPFETVSKSSSRVNFLAL